MEFLKLDKSELEERLKTSSYKELVEFFNFLYDVFDLSELMNLPAKLKNKKNHYQITKQNIVNLLVKHLENDDFCKRAYKKLIKTPESKYLYEKLVWERGSILADEVINKFQLEVEPVESRYYGWNEQKLEGDLSLIYHGSNFGYNDDLDEIFYIQESMKNILKLFLPLPEDYYLSPSINEIESEYSYNNEPHVLEFINVIADMLKNGLVEVGKSADKPLAKTLNILKASTSIKEFYSQKKMDFLATDMLTRSFYNYYFTVGFKKDELESLKEFVKLEFADKFSFFITRIFASHLKKVRFDDYYTSERELFDIVKTIILEMPKDDFVEFDRVIKYCKYRDYRFDFEDSYKTHNYYMECNILNYEHDSRVETLDARRNYNIIFFEPILKAAFFYLGALGLVELKYSDPISLYLVTAKDKPYISVWDGLEEIKLTNLGRYIFGFSKTYDKKEIKSKKTEVKFDEYKPIITLQNQDAIMIAKLEPYTEKYDTNRYILSYSKIFKDCKNYKALEFKIDSFYKKIEKNPPKVFIEFFDEIKNRANFLKRDLKQVVIELKNDKKLLNLFMTNKKLQEIVIKAQGYRIIVLKEDIPKLTKIVKDNGFFIDF